MNNYKLFAPVSSPGLGLCQNCLLKVLTNFDLFALTIFVHKLSNLPMKMFWRINQNYSVLTDLVMKCRRSVIHFHIFVYCRPKTLIIFLIDCKKKLSCASKMAF